MRALRYAILLAATIATSVVADADTITLRASAGVQAGAAVRLVDIATVEGADAQRFGDVVVIADASAEAAGATWLRVTLDQVRAALANESINWGRVALRGSTCTVRLRAPEATAPSNEDQPAGAAPSSASGPVVQDFVRAAVRRSLGVADEDLRIEWDSHDEPFLRRSTWGVRVETQPSTSSSSARQTVIVRLYEGDTLLTERSIRADVQVHAPVLTLTRQIERREAIRGSDVTAQRVWLAPDGSRPIDDASGAIGRVAESRLEAGLILRESHVEQPIAVERGKRVIVHCISGGVALKAKARALADGRIGEMVEMRLEGRPGTFMAKVSGHGVAVLSLDAGAHSAPRKESM